MRKYNLATVFLAAPTSTDERLQRIAEFSTGFIYAVSRTGVTGAQKQLPEDAQKLVQRLGKFTRLPIAVGFGISLPEQFRAVGKFAEAAVVGSAIVQLIESSPGNEANAVAKWIKDLLASAINHQPSAVSKGGRQERRIAGAD
jgi:tryptophan synthase alpha chain